MVFRNSHFYSLKKRVFISRRYPNGCITTNYGTTDNSADKFFQKYYPIASGKENRRSISFIRGSYKKSVFYWK